MSAPLIDAIIKAENTEQRLVAADSLAAFAKTEGLVKYAVRLLLPVIFHAIKESKWQSKIGAMDILSGLTQSAPQQISAALSDIIPIISETMWDSKPELRGVAERARSTLVRVGGGEPGSKDQVVIVAYSISAAEVLEVLKTKATFVKEDAFSSAVLAYVSTLCAELIASRNFEKDAWVSSIAPYLAVIGTDAEIATFAEEVNAFYVDFDAKNALSNAAVEDVEEGELLCDCEFSLAYG
ncbi:translational elongation factor EF-1 alpha, partial [Mortierella alpina]